MKNSIQIKSLSVQFNQQHIINSISFTLHKGEIGCLLGPSGCGKTTLLRAIAGFEPPAAGEIWIDDTLVSSANYLMPVEQRQIGMVFQDHALFPHMTVAKNITFGMRNTTKKERQDRLDELLSLLGLATYQNKYPHQLSGGQQQRVALARAIAPHPNILLLDEPFSNLDIELREQLAYQVKMILQQYRITALMVSHNQLEAFAMTDVIGVMNEGSLLQWDTAFNIYHGPNCAYVAEFIGEGVFIPGKVINSNTVHTALGEISGTTCHNHPLGSTVNVLIRPDDILHDDESPLQARVLDKTFRGATFLYTIELNDGGARLLSLVPSHHDHPLNDWIGIRLEIDHLVIF